MAETLLSLQFPVICKEHQNRYQRLLIVGNYDSSIGKMAMSAYGWSPCLQHNVLKTSMVEQDHGDNGKPMWRP